MLKYKGDFKVCNLKSKIIETIEKNKLEFGFMGTGPVKITLILSEEEIKEFKKIEIDEHINELYTLELEGNKLYVSYFTPQVKATT